MRIGLGYDAHKLVPDRNLVIGGVKIDYHLGLLGHSDADVLLHAIMDALLGAISLGDIGRHFPDTDEKYKNISSLKLLTLVADILDNNGYVIENIDTVIIAQKPKLENYKNTMRNNISKALGIEKDRINIKATTEEGMGFTGREEGIAAKAVCLVNKITYQEETKSHGCCCKR